MAKEKGKSEKESQPKPKNVGGRPPIFTKELADKVCHKVSTCTDGIRKICRENPDLPGHTVIFEWRLNNTSFAEQYATAKRVQAELLAEEIIDISDESAQDSEITENGVRYNFEYAARSRLRIDTRKWVAAKLLPKIYGERVINDTNVTFTHEQRQKELQALKKK